MTTSCILLSPAHPWHGQHLYLRNRSPCMEALFSMLVSVRGCLLLKPTAPL